MITEYDIAEYGSLRAEIEYRIKATERIEYALVIATAGYYAWLVTNPKLAALQLVVWLPILFPIIGVIRQTALLIRIVTISRYISTLEKRARPNYMGWETFLSVEKHKPQNVLIGVSGYVLWITLTVFIILIACHITANGLLTT